jgi:ATP-dependent helicase/nuclease subunit B
MAIQFILGGPGTGKTTSVIRQMANMKVDLPNVGSQLSSYFYVVPEQYTLKAQEKILQEVQGLLDIEVLSFNRLVYRFMDYIGLASHQMIQDTGKSMLIRQIIEDHVDEFKWITKHRKKTILYG